jgi:hypothetical protein
MSVNAVLAVTIGCSLYVFRWLYGLWFRGAGTVETHLDPPRAREASAP